MTSITDIPLDDIILFLKNNNVRVSRNDKNNYNAVFDMIIKMKGKDHPDSLVDWIIAYNFVSTKKPMKIYSSAEIDNLSQKQLNLLAKQLGSDSDDKQTITNILNYLHKLEGYKLLPDEIKFAELLPKLGVDAFVSLCAVDVKHRHLCDNDKFWQSLWIKDYGENELLPKGTYKTNYILNRKIENLYKLLVSDINFALLRPVDRLNKVQQFYLITELSVNNKNLISLPKEIGLLTNLWYLNLSINSLTELPEEIGLLTKLQQLYLDSNKLESLPREIGNLVNLYTLHINTNRIHELPEEILNLKNLRDFKYNTRMIKNSPVLEDLLAIVEHNKQSIFYYY